MEVAALATSITSALDDIADRLQLTAPRTGLEVRLFDTSWEMKRHLRQHCPEQSGKAAACYSRPGGYTVVAVKSSQPDSLDRTLRHELTHYLLASHYRDLPRWVDEGLAQYMEAPPPQHRDDKRREFRRRATPWTETAVRGLISLPAQQPLDQDQYLLSWAMVYFLMEEEGFGLRHIKSYLAQVNAGGDLRSYFESNFDSVTKLHSLWESFLTREGLAHKPTSCLHPGVPTTMQNRETSC